MAGGIAERSIGTKLRRTSGTPTFIADLTSIGEVGIENSEIDVTTLDSASNYKEFIAGFKDGGEISLTGFNKTEGNMAEMLAFAEAQTNQSYEIIFPTGAKWFFVGFVKMWKQAENSVEGVRGFTGAIRITGRVVYAATGISA